MKERPDIHASLRGLQPPRPPAGLRERVLASATAARAKAPATDAWTRIWEHRGVRLAWAACTAALLIGHVVVSLEGLRRPSRTTPTAFAPLPSDDELQAVAALPPIEGAALRRGYAAAASDPSAPSGGSAAHLREDPS